MALKKLVFKPGVNRDQTNYAGEGGWYACNKARFFSGFPQKIGGWTKFTSSQYWGVCRAIFNWASSAASTVGNFIALGTNEKIYVASGPTIYDITPLRTTSPNIALASPFVTTVLNSKTITLKFASSHNAVVGDWVTISGVTGPVGGIPTASINTEFKIVSVPTSTTLTVTTDTNATLSTSGGVAGSGAFQVPIGTATSLAGYGWGIPSWGGSTSTPTTGWGIAAVAPLSTPLRLVYFDKYIDDLLFNIRYGDIYYWNLSTIFPRAVTLTASGISGVSSVPSQVTQILFDGNSNVLMAFGCTAYSTAVYDPLLVRWASQANFANWAPSDDPGISTAGYLRVQQGSAILKAINNYSEILVFTESSLTSFKYTGTFPYLFSQNLLSAGVTLIGPNAVIAVNNVLYWMGHDKFFIYNGRVESLPSTLRQHVFENMNITEADQFFTASNERFNEVWWFYCSSGQSVIDSYVIYNYVEQLWYYGNCDDGMVRTAWTDSPLNAFPQGASAGYDDTVTPAVYAQGDNYLYDHESGVDAAGLPLPAYIRSADVDLEDGDKFVLVRRMIPDVSFTGSTSTSATVDMTLYPRNFPGDPYATANAEGQTLPRAVAITTNVDQFTNQVFSRVRARQIAFEISSDSLGVAWQLGAPRFDGRTDGGRA
jgi:hypothetical protein